MWKPSIREAKWQDKESHSVQDTLAETQNILSQTWYGSKGETYKITFGAGLKATCRRNDPYSSLGGTKMFDAWYDECLEFLWWGIKGAFFVDLADVRKNKHEVRWYRGDDWRKERSPGFVWWASDSNGNPSGSKLEMEQATAPAAQRKPVETHICVSQKKSCGSIRSPVQQISAWQKRANQREDELAAAEELAAKAPWRKRTDSSSCGEEPKEEANVEAKSEALRVHGSKKAHNKIEVRAMLPSAPVQKAFPPGLDLPPGLEDLTPMVARASMSTTDTVTPEFKGFALDRACDADENETSAGSEVSESDRSVCAAVERMCTAPEPEEIPRTKLTRLRASVDVFVPRGQAPEAHDHALWTHGQQSAASQMILGTQQPYSVQGTLRQPRHRLPAYPGAAYIQPQVLGSSCRYKL